VFAADTGRCPKAVRVLLTANGAGRFFPPDLRRELLPGPPIPFNRLGPLEHTAGRQRPGSNRGIGGYRLFLRILGENKSGFPFLSRGGVTSLFGPASPKTSDFVTNSHAAGARNQGVPTTPAGLFCGWVVFLHWCLRPDGALQRGNMTGAEDMAHPSGPFRRSVQCAYS